MTGVVRFAALATLTGCSALNYVTDSWNTPYYSGDEYPTEVEIASGAVMLGIQPEGDSVVHPTVLDVLSPVTLVDRGPTRAPAIDNNENIGLFGFNAAGNYIQRGEFESQQLLAIHPCDDTIPSCTVGTPGSAVSFEAILGMSTFGSDALRLDLGSDEVYVLPPIAGSEASRTYACDAVFPSPFAGGGTMIVGGTEVGFQNWRITVDACIAADPDPTIVQTLRGADALFVVSTGIGTSLISESAYERYIQLEALRGVVVPPANTMPTGSVLLPSGEITGYQATLPTLALVANAPDTNNQRGPCRQVYASHYLASGFCEDPDDAGSCPCTDNPDAKQYAYEYCGVPAVVELAPPAGVPVLVVDDSNPTLQALSTELAPGEPEVDGILGTSALPTIELDIDYTNSRLLGRCADRTTCATRPELCTPNGCSTDERVQVQRCLGIKPDECPLPPTTTPSCPATPTI
jgi:hypothetical protein